MMTFIPGHFYRRKDAYGALAFCATDCTSSSHGRLLLVYLKTGQVVDATPADPVWFDEVSVSIVENAP